MEQEKSKDGLIIFLVVVIIVLVLLCTMFAMGTISFNKGDSNKNTVETTTDSNQEDTTWTNYLLSRHILEAKLSRKRSTSLGDSEDIDKTVTLSMDQVKEVLSNLEGYKLSKNWSEGRGGPDRDHLIISYEVDEQRYDFEIYYGTISVEKLDDGLKNILETSKVNEKNIEYRDKDGAFYFYSLDDFTETVFDKYFE